MKILVLGASGATGKHLVEQLLLKKQHVKVVVRPSAHIPDTWASHEQVSIIRADVSTMQSHEAAYHASDCDAIACCLGHTMSLKGIFGKPRSLVVNTLKLFCNAIKKNALSTTVKLVLMNSIGCRNKDLNEQVSFGQKIAMSAITALLPPHRDNEKAADYLRSDIGQKTKEIEWVVVRPDNLINTDNITPYETYASPSNTLFTARKVSRINVAHFMASLLTEYGLWEEWKGRMPVIYNQ